MKAYQKRERESWRLPRSGDTLNGDLGLCVFDPDRDHMHYAMPFMHENGWDLAECVDEPDEAKKRKWGKDA